MAADENNTSESYIKKIFDEHYRSLVQYANRFLGIDECEDLVQDIFIGLWEKENAFPDELHLKVYLYKAVRNKCYNVINSPYAKKHISNSIMQV